MEDQIKFYVQNIALPALQVPEPVVEENSEPHTAIKHYSDAISDDELEVKRAILDVEDFLYYSELDAVKGAAVTLPYPNDPFTIDLPNCEVLMSPTLSVGEILSDERINLPFPKSQTDHRLYEDVIESSCQVLGFERPEGLDLPFYEPLLFLPCENKIKIVQLQGSKVKEGLNKIEHFFDENMVPLLNDMQIEHEVHTLFESSTEQYQNVREAPHHSVLALFQLLESADILDTVEQWHELLNEFRNLCFERESGEPLLLSSAYFEPEHLKLLLRLYTQNLDLQYELSTFLELSEQHEYQDFMLLVDDIFLKECQQHDSYCKSLICEAREDNFLIGEVVCVSLLYYCVRHHYVESVHTHPVGCFFLPNDYEINPHCVDYFSQTNLNYALKVYKQVLAYNYRNVPTSIAHKVLLPDETLEVISDKGTPFIWSSDKHIYEPAEEIYHDFSAILQARKEPQRIEAVSIPEAAPMVTENDQKIEVQEFSFDDFNRDRGCYDEAIRNLQKMAVSARQRIIKRYRSNKNANSINAECIRCRKFFNDIESIKKRFLNENRSSSTKKIFTGVKREKKDKEAVKKTNLFQEELVKNKLDETERYIEELLKQKSVDDTQQQKEILDSLIKDDEVKGTNGLNIEIRPTPKAFNGVLKHYEKIGFSWLYHMFISGLSCLLCDQMGLGKTIQVIAYFLQICEVDHKYGPFLVICPNSLLNNWIEEIRRFAPDFNVWPYWGSTQQREAIREGWSHTCFMHEVLQKYGDQSFEIEDDEKFGTRKCPFHVLVTSYSLAVSDIKHLNKIPWVTVVLDEGQMIKSSETKRWRTLMNMMCNEKIILSGTPIQNTLTELWSLLHFALPEVFRSRENFTQWFTRDIEMAASERIGEIKLNPEQLSRLESILSPFVLRREKKDVAEELGEKKENTLFCNLSRQQKSLYSRIKQKINFEELFNCASDDELKNIVMQLRKVVNHPQIFERSRVRMPFVLLETENQRIAVYNEENDDDDRTDAETEATVAAEKLNTSMAESETTTTVIPAIKRAKIKLQTQQLDDFADLIQIQHQSDRAREMYIECSIRSDQNRFVEYDIPGAVFDAFVGLDSDRGFAVHQLVARRFALWDVLSDIYDIMGISFAELRAATCVVRCLLRNASYLLDLSGNLGVVSRFSQAQVLLFVCDFVFRLQARVGEFFGRPVSMVFRTPEESGPLDPLNSPDQSNTPIPALIGYDFPRQILTCSPAALGFAPLLRTSAANYWENRTCGLYDYCGGDVSLMSSLLPAEDECLTPLFCYSADHLIEQSGKLNALDKLLSRLFSQRQVCLIYCEMTKMMDLLEEYLFFRRYKYVRLDGSYSVTERRAAVDKFMTDDTIFIFLLSTRAGSLGLNLTRASNVIFYEQDWNPTEDLQAEDRVHRLGQTKEVQVWKIIARNSIDEKIFERAEQKTVVQKLVLSGQERDENGNLISEIYKKQNEKDLLLNILNE